MKIVATIEARMASSRLPGKILKEAVEKPLLELMVERVRRSKWLNEVVVATTVESPDDVTEQACREMGVKCYRGSNDDVLERVLKAAQAHGADLIVELTGDCPLIDPVEMDKVIQYYLDNSFDYVSNFRDRLFPRGTETQVFSVKVLEDVARRTQDSADHEHVSLFIYEHPEIYKLGGVSAEPLYNRPDLRLTVDTPQDYELVKTVFEKLYPGNSQFTLKDIIQLLDSEPALKALNQQIQQKPVR